MLHSLLPVTVLSMAVGNAPRNVAMRSAKSVSPVMGLESMPGGYALGGTFDPLGFAEKGDLIWLREAEIKHGRLSMLAVVGYIANDLGIHFPGPQYAGVSSLAAHDVMVKVCDACRGPRRAGSPASHAPSPPRSPATCPSSSPPWSCARCCTRASSSRR